MNATTKALQEMLEALEAFDFDNAMRASTRMHLELRNNLPDLSELTEAQVHLMTHLAMRKANTLIDQQTRPLQGN